MSDPQTYLKAVIGRIKEVRVVADTKFITECNHISDQIVDAKKCAPPVLEHIGDDSGSVVGDHGLRWDVAMLVRASGC